MEMMCESSLTFIPLDDPVKEVKLSSYDIGLYISVVSKVAEEVIEKGFDGSDIIKIKGRLPLCLFKNYPN